MNIPKEAQDAIDRANAIQSELEPIAKAVRAAAQTLVDLDERYFSLRKAMYEERSKAFTIIKDHVFAEPPAEPTSIGSVVDSLRHWR